MRKTTRNMIALALMCAVSLLLVASSQSQLRVNAQTATPGPEGVDCTLYGVQANDGLQLKEQSLPTITGKGTLSVVGSVQPYSWIASGSSGSIQIGYQWTRPDPKTPQIRVADLINGQVTDLGGLSLTMAIERPQVSDLNQHGYPEGTNSPETLDWYSYNTNVVNGSSQVTWNHYEAYVVPVDFYVTFTVLPLTDGSWGAFEGVDLWFKLNTNMWLDAFTQGQMLQAQDAIANGTTVTAANYRGAFPIWGWIGQWDPYTVKLANGDTANPNNVPPEISAYTNVEPSFAGREVSLYSQPSWISSQVQPVSNVASSASVGNALGQSIGSIGDRSQTAYYIPITLTKFGGLYQYTGGWWNPGSQYYYPSATMRIRVLYAVWGEWVYLWTNSEANKHGYTWDNRSSTTIINPGWWDQLVSGLSTWLAGVVSNPLNLIWLFLILGAIIVIIVSIASPGIWTVLASSRKKT